MSVAPIPDDPPPTGQEAGWLAKDGKLHHPVQVPASGAKLCVIDHFSWPCPTVQAEQAEEPESHGGWVIVAADDLKLVLQHHVLVQTTQPAMKEAIDRLIWELHEGPGPHPLSDKVKALAEAIIQTAQRDIHRHPGPGRDGSGEDALESATAIILELERPATAFALWRVWDDGPVLTGLHAELEGAQNAATGNGGWRYGGQGIWTSKGGNGWRIEEFVLQRAN